MNQGPADRSAISGVLRNQGPGFAIEVLINLVLPYLIYDQLQGPWGEVRALIVSSAPPLIWAVVTFIRTRHVDFISAFVLVSIGLSLLALLGGGSVKFLQLRERMVTFVIGLAFLGSAAIGRPIIWELAQAGMKRQNNQALAAELAARKDDPAVKRTFMVMTLVWGCGLLLDAALAVVLVMRLSVKQYLIAGPILGYGFTGALALWTVLYVRRRRRSGDARRAREATSAGAS